MKLQTLTEGDTKSQTKEIEDTPVPPAPSSSNTNHNTISKIQLNNIVNIKELRLKAIKLNICPECGSPIEEIDSMDVDIENAKACSLDRKHYYKGGGFLLVDGSSD